jgi:hypothetical protein
MTDPDATPAHEAPDERSSLGRELAERQRPLRARRAPLVGASLASRPGTLGRRTFDFSVAAGLSLSSRRAMGLATPDLGVAGLPVAPPAEWDESHFEPVVPRTGNATLDHIIATQMRTAAAKKRPTARRGLRAATARHSTRVGRDTAPGASARRLRPQVAPMSRDLEIQRLVSGEGPDTRPRAPRSGPSFSGSSSPRTPRSRPGREARGRLGRPAPWREESAHQAAPAVSVADPVQVAAALAAGIAGIGGADHGASGLHLPRRLASLPPSIHAPRHDPAAAAAAPAPAARMAARSAAVVESAPVGSGGLMPPVVDVTEPAVAGGSPSGEPVLATLLRGTPPALALSSPPRRAFSPAPAPTVALPGGGAASPASLGALLAADLPVGGSRPLGLGTVAAVTTPGAAPRHATGVPGGPAPAATPPGRPQRSSATGAAGLPSSVSSPGAPVASPGLARTVAASGSAMSAASAPSASSSSSPASASVPPALAATAGSVPISSAASPRAPRAVRTLPDLGSPAASIPAGPGSGGTASRRAPLTAAPRPDEGVGHVRAPGEPHGTPSTPDLPVSPPAVVPSDPAEQFTRVLEEHAPPTARPLPKRFEPIARAILTRPERVRISTDRASRAALSAVGKAAATSGEVVHLARPLDASSASIDVLAHELTHVAHPSPAVRFYGDDRHTNEERLANQIGEVMAKAPVGTPPVSPPPGQAEAGRQGAGGGNGAGSSSRQGGAALPPPPSGRHQGGVGASSPAAPAAPAGVLDPTADRGAAGGAGLQGGAAEPPTAAAAGIDIDRLLDALEARVIRELERRGRRWPRPI